MTLKGFPTCVCVCFGFCRRTNLSLFIKFSIRSNYNYNLISHTHIYTGRVNIRAMMIETEGNVVETGNNCLGLQLLHLHLHLHSHTLAFPLVWERKKGQATTRLLFWHSPLGELFFCFSRTFCVGSKILRYLDKILMNLDSDPFFINYETQRDNIFY